MPPSLRVILVKPSKYGEDGFVERFRWGYMPNSTLPYLRALTPASLDGAAISVRAIDEYVETELRYLDQLRGEPGVRTLVALVGVQSHQFQRALDLAALALARGAEGAVVGGPHPMTCDTTEHQGRGVSFALSEAEPVWSGILRDAMRGELRPTYGGEARWQEEADLRLAAPVVDPPSRRQMRRYVVPMLGVYPARGCPFTCNFCSVIKIAGRELRSQPVETTLATLRRAKAAGVKLVCFTSDNFNKYPDAVPLLEAMIAERLELPFFCQCDTQVAAQPGLIALLARAGCFQLFFGAESFNRRTLVAAHKTHNRPERYRDIVALCREHGITSHFANILGFPEDTEEGIEEHLATLRALDPDVASFYILTPIPGTEQYDDFLARGLITERELDRFDGTCPTWSHPALDATTLRRLLRRCYREFYAWPATLRKAARPLGRRDFRAGAAVLGVAGQAAVARYGAWRLRHPMAGGVVPVRRDRREDYLALRRARFGVEGVPLPRSLELSAADAARNRRAKLPRAS
jgi:hypothetical protein